MAVHCETQDLRMLLPTVSGILRIFYGLFRARWRRERGRTFSYFIVKQIQSLDYLLEVEQALLWNGDHLNLFVPPVPAWPT